MFKKTIKLEDVNKAKMLTLIGAFVGMLTSCLCINIHGQLEGQLDLYNRLDSHDEN